MVKGVGLNGTMVDANNYSSPVPLVGLYIAAASMVCFLLILCDVWVGFKRKKYWFPCRFFSVNSLTLTLISITTKIPVDLTSDMPSKQDQLSKLSGTVLICLYMSFMHPSIATDSELESFANVMALSIFVITVVVNICIQIATGVIFTFIPEHVIVLICMLLVLFRFWASDINMVVLKRDYIKKSEDLLRAGEENMLARLKLCYLYGYHNSPQLESCTNLLYKDVTIVCMMSSIVYVQATVRSFALKGSMFHEGISDYGWSMWLVFSSQSLTVVLITFSIGGRWLLHLCHYGDYHRHDESYDMLEYLQFLNLFSVAKIPKFVEISFHLFIYIPLSITNLLLGFLNACLHGFIYVSLTIILMMISCGKYEVREKIDEKSKEFKNKLTSRHIFVVNWILNRGVGDMQRWMEMNEQVSPKRLPCLLSTVSPSRESPYKIGLNGEGIKISLLSIVYLVEITKRVITAPTSCDTVSLTNILDEIYEVIDFIDNKTNTGSSEDRFRYMLARVIQKYGFRRVLGGYVLQQNTDLENHRVNLEFIQGPRIEAPVHRCIIETSRQVSDLINFQSDESIEVVYGRIQQIFVDMLHAFLAQLPIAVFTHILESPVAEYEERARLGLRYICRLQSVESYIRFSFPSGSNITSLFNTQMSATHMRAEGPQVEGLSTPSPNIAQAVEDVGEIQDV